MIRLPTSGAGLFGDRRRNDGSVHPIFVIFFSNRNRIIRPALQTCIGQKRLSFEVVDGASAVRHADTFR